jgi:hypothetical protein
MTVNVRLIEGEPVAIELPETWCSRWSRPTRW